MEKPIYKPGQQYLSQSFSIPDNRIEDFNKILASKILEGPLTLEKIIETSIDFSENIQELSYFMVVAGQLNASRPR